MAYTKTTWAANDVITAAKLNKAEQGIYDAQNGWEVGLTQLFSETFVSSDGSGTLAYLSNKVTAETAEITFDGVEYTCQNDGYGNFGASFEDAWDWSTYPFQLSTDAYGENAWVSTQTDGTHTIACSIVTMTTTENFDKAVQKALSAAKLVYEVKFSYAGTWSCDRTMVEIQSAISAGYLIEVYINEWKCLSVSADEYGLWGYAVKVESGQLLLYNLEWYNDGSSPSVTNTLYTLTPA